MSCKGAGYWQIFINIIHFFSLHKNFSHEKNNLYTSIVSLIKNIEFFQTNMCTCTLKLTLFFKFLLRKEE